jgi:GNAT superfamily N-acetyltransferase
VSVGGIGLRTYQGGDAAACVSIWNAAMGDAFPIDERLWRQNIDDDPNFDARGIVLALDQDNPVGFVAARVGRVPLGLQAIDPAKGWINSIAVLPAAQRRGTGRRLLERAQAWLRSKRVSRVQLGGDPGHFFPGIPSGQDAAHAFFQASGYSLQGQPCWDLRADIKSFRVPALVDRVMARNLHFRITQCATRNVPALLEFLRATFPGRWLYETQLRLQAERSPVDIQVLLIGNRVVGFAHTWHNGSQRIGPSIYWRKLLGPAFGGLGPMGVSVDVRNSGLGFALLCESVERLRNLGVTNMAVDWTVLKKFYGAAGFEPWKEYVSYAAALT